MKKKLLFVTYGGGHVHMVYPVVQALHKSREYLNGEIETHVLGMPSAKAALSRLIPMKARSTGSMTTSMKSMKATTTSMAKATCISGSTRKMPS